MPKLKVSVLNRGRKRIAAVGRWFSPQEVTTVELDETQLARLRHQRGLRVVATESPADEPAWGTSVKSAIAWVGDDQERAAEVLEAEQARGDDARTSLVKALEKVLAPTT